MARAAVGDDRIGVSIETSYDGSGVRAARSDNTALGREARVASQQLAAAAQEGAIADKTLAGAAREAAAEQQKLTLSTQQSRAMWSQAGGDYSRFLELVRAHVAQEQALAQATSAATAAQRQQTQAQGAGSVGGGGGVLPSAAAQSVARVADQVDKIPAKARTAANSLAMMAFAAAEGGGNLRGLAIAAGTATDGLANLTNNARLVAGAAGLGAIVTVTAVVIGLFDRMEERARETGKALGSSLGNFTDQALEARRQAVDASFAIAQQRNLKARQGGGILGIDINLPELTRSANELEKLAAEREAIFTEQLDRRRSKGRDAAKEQKQIEEQDAKRSKDMLHDLSDEYLDAYEKRTQTAEGAARIKAEREFSERLDEIRALQVQEDVKTQLIAAAAKDRSEKLLDIHLDAAARQNEIEDKLWRDQQERYDKTLESVKQTSERALDAAITGSESYISAVTKTLLSPLVHKLEAIAVEQGIDALASAAFFDFVGAARHAAVAAAAIAGAQKVAQIAGMTAGGGGSGAGAGGPALSTRDPREAQGNVTVILQTVNPFSNEVIGETSFQLQRAGTLKRPIYPPNSYRTSPLVGGSYNN